MTAIDPTVVLVAQLVAAAMERHGSDITPCSRRTSWRECITRHEIGPACRTLLWFNTPDGSTRVVAITEGAQAS